MRYGCPQCRDEVSVRQAGELSHLARARLDAHLDACCHCRSFASRYAASIEAARAWSPILTAARKEAILDGICARREPARGRRIPRSAAAAIWLPAAVALVWFVLARPGSEATPPLPTSRVAARPELPAHVDSAQADRTWQPGGRRVAADAVRTRRPRQSAAPAPPAVDLPQALRARSLYADAERALAEERPAGMARILEELIERCPGTEEAQSARLELGRLYAGPLGNAARAVVHLSAFVAGEPEPSARGAAKGLLCRLLPAAERNRLCWHGLTALAAHE